MSKRKESRNERLVRFYKSGASMRETAAKFKLSLGRVQQILWREAPKMIRPKGDPRNNSTGLHPSAR